MCIRDREEEEDDDEAAEVREMLRGETAMLGGRGGETERQTDMKRIVVFMLRL